MPVVKMELGELDAMRNTEKKLREDIEKQKLDYEKKLQKKKLKSEELQKEIDELSVDVPIIAIHNVNEKIDLGINRYKFDNYFSDSLYLWHSLHESENEKIRRLNRDDMESVAKKEAKSLVCKLEPIITANYKAFLDSDFISVKRNSTIERKKIVHLDKIKNMVIKDVDKAIELENKNLKVENKTLLKDMLDTKESVEKQVKDRVERARISDKGTIESKSDLIDHLNEIRNNILNKHEKEFKYVNNKMSDLTNKHKEEMKDMKREYESNAQAKIDLKKDKLVQKLQERIETLESGRGFFARLFGSKKLETQK